MKADGDIHIVHTKKFTPTTYIHMHMYFEISTIENIMITLNNRIKPLYTNILLP